MDIAEAVVERFITLNAMAQDGLAVLCPQFVLRDEEHPGWKADLDFVVLQFLNDGGGRIILVEVSDSGGLGSVDKKAALFANGEYDSRLKSQIDRMTGGMTDNWFVCFLGFLRTSRLAEKAQAKFDRSDMFFRSIEQAFCEGYWELRQEGLLEPKPKEGERA